MTLSLTVLSLLGIILSVNCYVVQFPFQQNGNDVQEIDFMLKTKSGQKKVVIISPRIRDESDSPVYETIVDSSDEDDEEGDVEDERWEGGWNTRVVVNGRERHLSKPEMSNNDPDHVWRSWFLHYCHAHPRCNPNILMSALPHLPTQH